MADPKGLRAAAAKLGARLAHEDSVRKHSAAQARAAENAAVRDKYRRIAEHRRYPKKDRYSWEELVIGSMAMDAGVNRYYAMKAGRQAKQVLDYLSQAAQAAKPESKAKALRLARRHLADVSREHHPELVEQLEGRILWEEGWRPETWDSERNAPREHGPSINPQTGQQEFFSYGGLWDNTLGRLAGSTEAVEPTDANSSILRTLNKRPEDPVGRIENLPATSNEQFELTPMSSSISSGNQSAPPKILPTRNPRDLASNNLNPSPGGIERNDADGKGWDGAGRGRRPHVGTDITVNAPGDPIIAPIEGVIKKRGWPYTIDKEDKENYHSHNNNLRTVVIEGTGAHKGQDWEVFYLDDKGPAVGATVKPGDFIGNYADVTLAHPKLRNMQHHIHVRTRYNGNHIDPGVLLPNWKSQRPK